MAKGIILYSLPKEKQLNVDRTMSERRPDGHFSKSDIDHIIQYLNRKKVKKPEGAPPAAPASEASTGQPRNDQTHPSMFGILIRQSASDVLANEDPGSETHQKDRQSLQGAAFSYSRNYKSRGDDWSIKGAIIRPFDIELSEAQKSRTDFHLDSLTLAPSISLDKISSETTPKNDVDNLIFRTGLSAHWAEYPQDYIAGMDVRGYASYGTDTSFRSSIVAGEFELEPLFSWVKPYEAGWGIGYKESPQAATNAIAPKAGKTASQADGSNFIYQVRTYLHGEFGDIRKSKDNPDVDEGGFFRMGPVVKLEVTPCYLARSLGLPSDAITAHAAYSYDPELGQKHLGRDDLFSTGIDWALFTSDANQKVSLKILYECGGLDLSKQKVDALTLGLGVTF